MKLVLAACLALPALAQFTRIEVRFEGMGCVPCVESMPERARRMRGVESAAVDKERGVLTLVLAAPNRIKLEQVRDAVEQDGTKARSARVALRGVVARGEGGWTIQPAGGAARYALEGDQWRPGEAEVKGEASDLHPQSGVIRIRAVE